ncbi:hypothetical protein [Rhodococcus sp. P1Y]|uniref:hypothetical protein n=1 Tax=Rhodococcus sp. P1Y TaxID=1302308 RepID=UPI001293B6D8|nr:hypothetical protein [Rhodococcus sp. P1Y]
MTIYDELGFRDAIEKELKSKSGLLPPAPDLFFWSDGQLTMSNACLEQKYGHRGHAEAAPTSYLPTRLVEELAP